MANRLTEQGNEVRKRIYDFIVEYFKEYGYSPSVREIGEAVNLKSTSSVYSHLNTMVREGKIKMRGNSPRTIHVIGYEFVKQNENEEKENVS